MCISRVGPHHPLFFYAFTLERGVDNGGDWSWVFLRQTKKFFSIYTDTLRSFKDKYFLTRPKIRVALDNDFDK